MIVEVTIQHIFYFLFFEINTQACFLCFFVLDRRRYCKANELSLSVLHYMSHVPMHYDNNGVVLPAFIVLPRVYTFHNIFPFLSFRMFAYVNVC